MSDNGKNEAATPAEGKDKPSGNGSIVPWIAVGVISAGLGSAMPFLLGGQPAATASEDDAEATAGSEENGSAANGQDPAAKKQKKVKAFTLPKEEETVFLPFGDKPENQRIVVNLDEGRLTRYLSVSITMQIPKSSEEEFKKKVEAKRILLRNWLLSKISDLDIEDIRGAAGQNRLRREIRDHFNSILCPDGYEQIYDVLFEEFNVQ